MEKKIETTIRGSLVGLYRDDGKENGNYDKRESSGAI